MPILHLLQNARSHIHMHSHTRAHLPFPYTYACTHTHAHTCRFPRPPSATAPHAQGAEEIAGNDAPTTAHSTSLDFVRSGSHRRSHISSSSESEGEGMSHAPRLGSALKHYKVATDSAEEEEEGKRREEEEMIDSNSHDGGEGGFGSGSCRDSDAEDWVTDSSAESDVPSDASPCPNNNGPSLYAHLLAHTGSDSTRGTTSVPSHTAARSSARLLPHPTQPVQQTSSHQQHLHHSNSSSGDDVPSSATDFVRHISDSNMAANRHGWMAGHLSR